MSGSDLRDAYFEDARLHGLKVNHLTNFGERIASGWSKREIPDVQKPDIYRSIRLAYEDAEIWDTMDVFLAAEHASRRKGLLWPAFKKSKSLKTFSTWLGSLCRGAYSNYATSPWRAVFITALIPVFFAFVYLAAGLPNAAASSTSNVAQSVGQSLYFSLTTFTTLGYGDVTYSADRPFLRFLSTLEAFAGAVSMALLVVIFARKVIR
ncbi:potassium channel family protein [Marivita sp.]|uniref:potassium channel family protein n=1 Tax=Marivita sp. TaxID=2003365 RepID=UPI003F6AFA3B